MSKLDAHDWKLDDISERDIRVSDKIKKILLDWDKEYKDNQKSVPVDNGPTPEQIAFLAEAKAKGWV